MSAKMKGQKHWDRHVKHIFITYNREESVF